ncbi:MAG: O-acetyl-ADP-ribose deacetylase [Anaerolineae bacterium]|jgi:O-acetyl-ADP-ribose deacetylase (regulator of RNase III)|nr:O-acetyl-ADP-ribose deacetylase [Anaerolineae bacterium]
MRVHLTEIELIEGDITHQDVDAIVNAANSSLLGGGGVDGAIHRAAGKGLLEECRRLNGCQTGDAKITQGYLLKARHVIHAVGPVYERNNPIVPQQLASAYRRSLEVAFAQGITTIAFPAISTGVYGYPMREAAEIALQTVIAFVQTQEQIRLVRFVLFGKAALMTFSEVLETLAR